MFFSNTEYKHLLWNILNLHIEENKELFLSFQLVFFLELKNTAQLLEFSSKMVRPPDDQCETTVLKNFV